jgi:hypothetical protein
MYYYALLFFFFVIAVIFAYFRMKYGFWIHQPVFHCYDIHYMVFPPGIITHELPQKNKYTNFKDITTSIISHIDKNKRGKFMNIIKSNYLRNGDNVFSPKEKNVMSYFIGHNHPCFISFYNQEELLNDEQNSQIIEQDKLIGTMTTRPLLVSIKQDATKAKENERLDFPVYYADYLCVDKSKRKQGIAPKIIQTHEYNQRHMNKNVVVSLFKKEDELTGIMPMCIYKTYGFSVDSWRKPTPLIATHSVVEIGTTNMHLLLDFIKENMNQFDMFIIPETANVVELVKTENIFIHIIISAIKDRIIAVYFLKKSNTFIERNKEVLSCFGSIQSKDECDDDLFIQGFKIAFWNVANQHKFGFAAIERISHNWKLIDNISLKTTAEIVSPSAYFFYNFACPTFNPERTLVID